MTQFNNNLSPLPFYTSKDQWNSRKPYAYGAVYPLFCKVNTLLPWQAYIPKIASVKIYYADGTLWRDVTEDALLNVHYYSWNSGNDVISYFAPSFAISYDQPEGRYYVEINDGRGVTLYSELYTAVQDMSALLKVEWWDDETLIFDAGRVAYANGYKNYVYLATQLGKPQYNFDEEGEQRDGYFFPTKMMSEKTYHFQFLAPEYLCDAMRLARLSDHIRVTDQYGAVYDCDTFLITPKWGQNGDVATVTAEFDTNTVVKKTGRAATGSGDYDFNGDYSSDYLINNPN
jgi:hypothetical protein